MITDEDRDRVRAATDLVELVQETVELKPRGREFWGCCPFHGEKTPSFHVIPATQVWHCFGCNQGGDVFTYVMLRENLSFPEAIRYLADRAGVEIHEERGQFSSGTKRGRLVSVCEATADFYHTMLMRGRDDRGRRYCAERGLSSDVCARYRLGYAPGRGTLVARLRELGFSDREMVDANVAIWRSGSTLADRFYERVMFPIFDEQGKCIAFGGRILGEGEPKYLNTAETSLFHKKRNLYGFNWAKEHIVAQGEAIVVEGYTDCIACWEAGIGNVVATLGTALTEQHVKTLTRFAKRIVYLFDGDAAGQKAAERAVQFVETDSVDLRCVILPDDLDPNDFVRTQGGDALRQLLASAEPLLDFVFRRLVEKSDVTTPAGRAKALSDALRLIYPLRDSYILDSYYMQIADRLGMEPSSVREAGPRVFTEVRKQEAASARRAEMRERAQRDRSRRQPVVSPQPPSSNFLAPDELDADYFVPDDYVPYDDAPVPQAPGDAPVPSPLSPTAGALTDFEAGALACERELVGLLTAYPDDFRAFAERIWDIDWMDERNAVIAFAVLGTPAGSTPQQVMDAVRRACPEAPTLVGAGTLDVTSSHPTQTNIEFLLDTLELLTLKRRMGYAKARLRSDKGLSAEDRRSLFIQATQDSARVRELAQAVESVANPFRYM